MSEIEWRKKRTGIIHSNDLIGYSKDFPNQKRIDFDIETRDSFGVTINSRGLKGRDFSDRTLVFFLRVLIIGTLYCSSN